MLSVSEMGIDVLGQIVYTLVLTKIFPSVAFDMIESVLCPAKREDAEV
jgi:hypothetical protein